MKVLQINNVYDFGSTGKITRDIHHGLIENGFDSVVYYGRRYKTNDEGVYKICSELYGKAQNGLYQICGIKYGGCAISTNRLIKAIRQETPDVVHLQCLNGHFVNVYRLLEFLKRNKIPTILTLHAEFMYTGGCSHALECNQWQQDPGCCEGRCPQFRLELKSKMGDKSSEMWRRMKRAFDGFEQLTIVSVSPWLMERAKNSPILGSKKHTFVLNGLETDVFHSYGEKDLFTLKHEFGIKENDKIIFHASPSFDNNPSNIKGGYYVLKMAERFPEYKFLVAGKYDPSIKVSPNVKLLGNLTDKNRMAMLYSMANITLLTSKRETFSMICAESLCCGTPVVGFKAGAPERISIPTYSQFCEYGDLDKLETLISTCVKRDKPSDISREAMSVYDRKKMVKDYIKIYRNMC